MRANEPRIRSFARPMVIGLDNDIQVSEHGNKKFTYIVHHITCV